jgi:hypothetical protein
MDEQLSYSSGLLDNPIIGIGGIFGLGMASSALGKARVGTTKWNNYHRYNPGPIWNTHNLYGSGPADPRALGAAQSTIIRPTRALRTRRTISNKYKGDVGAFMRRGTLADVSPAADKYINQLTRNPFKRARLREHAMNAAVRKASPRLANRMQFFHGMRGLMGGLNTYFTAQMVGFGLNLVNDMVSTWRPQPRVNKKQMLELGGDYIDTREAYTQRQRALQAIHNSQLTTRAVIGNEASMLHYG